MKNSNTNEIAFSVKYLIVIVLSLFTVPIFINLIMNYKTKFEVAGSNDWIGFYGSYIGAIIGGLVAFGVAHIQIRHQNEKDRLQERLNNRSFITIEEKHGVKVDLSNLKVIKNARLIETKGFKDLSSSPYSDSINTSFYVLSHYGNPSIIHNCQVDILYTSNDDNDIKTLTVFVGRIEKSEQIYLPLAINNLVREIIVDKVFIKYNCISGEQIKYIYDLGIAKERYEVIEGGKPIKIFEFPLQSILWRDLKREN